MTRPDYLGSRERAHGIKRVRLLTAEQWMKGEGTCGKDPGFGTAFIGESGLRRPTWARGTKIALDTTNQFGYTSASAQKYPEAFKPVDTKFWQPLSKEETLDIHARQAAANLKATSDEDDSKLAIGRTEADNEYAMAQGHRNMLLRRRKLLTQPATWEERKRRDEELRKAPLSRRYSSGEAAFRESTTIVRPGPLDTPILVDGLPTLNASVGKQPSTRLKLKRNRVGGYQPDVTSLQTTKHDYASITLPSFNSVNSPRTQLIGPTRNGWGLPSRSEMMYPEAYREMAVIYWKQLTGDERKRIDTVQARAMEKAGYEPGTEKHFINDIVDNDEFVITTRGRTDDTNRVSTGNSTETSVVLLILIIMLGVLAWYSMQTADSWQTAHPNTSAMGDD
jgi:hypothetical protein